MEDSEIDAGLGIKSGAPNSSRGAESSAHPDSSREDWLPDSSRGDWSSQGIQSSRRGNGFSLTRSKETEKESFEESELDMHIDIPTFVPV